MTDSNLTARIGSGYYQQIGEGKQVGNDKIWTIKINNDASITDTNHRGKYALIKHSGGDTYITYGTKDEITGAINNSTQPQQLKTRYFDADNPSSTKVDNGGGEKLAPTEDNVDKAWAFANSSDATVKQTWDYYASQINTDAGSGNPPPAGTKPEVKNANLGEIDTDDANAKASIEFKNKIQLVDPNAKLKVKVNGTDKEINAADVSVNGKNLEIKASALKTLGLNPGANNSIEIKAGQIADENDKASIEFKNKIQLVDPNAKLKVKVNGTDKEINAADVSVNGKNLEIKASALKTLGLNPGANNSIEIKAGQIADENDKNVTNDAATVTIKPKASGGGADTTAPVLQNFDPNATPPQKTFDPANLFFQFDDQIKEAGLIIKDNTGTDVTSQFTITIEGNKVKVAGPFKDNHKYKFTFGSGLTNVDDKSSTAGIIRTLTSQIPEEDLS
ncbi:MAG: hypothetical protein HRT47_14130 [Candidatus Caenarcaniphilales bacterium]|nr:hypothetical protein [Candidatus Caenarcaniphilales bacterium]